MVRFFAVGQNISNTGVFVAICHKNWFMKVGLVLVLVMVLFFDREPEASFNFPSSTAKIMERPMFRDDKKNKEPARSEDQTRPERDHEPWWADDGPQEKPLPEGFPERPDVKKVHDLRASMRQERAEREAAGRNRMVGKFSAKTGKQVRQIGSYTLIPMMMMAGPAVGYGLGWLLEKQFGGKPWVSVFGILFGLAAAFQQIIIILKKNSE